MRYGIAVLGLIIMGLVFIAGCTSPQSGATSANGQNSGTRSVAPRDTVSGYSSQQIQVINCDTNCPDMKQFEKLFPDIAGYHKMYTTNFPINRYRWECSILNTYGKHNSNFTMLVLVRDYSTCNMDSEYFVKNLKLLEEVMYNGTTSSSSGHRSIITYHGYPTFRIGGYDEKVAGVYLHMAIDPKLSVNIYANLNRDETLSEAEIDAEIEKLAGAMDYTGIISTGNTIHSLSTPAITAKKSPVIKVTAHYNPQDGMITVTNTGGSDTADLSFITVSVNGANTPANLGPTAGSQVTAPCITGSKNHVTATATFRNGVQQLVLDTVVGP